VTEGRIYPHLIGSDIGCALALFQTDLLRREAKVERWSELRFNSSIPWDEFVCQSWRNRNFEIYGVGPTFHFGFPTQEVRLEQR